jgi:choline dehydrogenase-like flavoprotein
MNCVIGSGPAGIAVAHALITQGKPVLMLDSGISLEPERAMLVERMGKERPELWDSTDLASYQAGMNPDVGGVPLKLVYGSDFAYQQADSRLGAVYDNAGLRPSLARGGLSNVWGAAMLPYRQADIASWPITVQQLAPHYSAVLDFVGLMGREDMLAATFPLYTKRLSRLEPSRQAARLLQRMESARSSLAAGGIQFGYSRLALRGQTEGKLVGDTSTCNYCRLCMYGCPYDHIYSSAMTLKELLKHPGFTYQPGVLIEKTGESASAAWAEGIDLKTGETLRWEASRLFVGAGVIATTKILLRSLEIYDQPVWLKDSQYFLVPLALYRKVKGAATERSFGLSQAFIELIDADCSNHTVHLQIYSNSDLISQTIAAPFGPFQKPFSPLIRDLQERLVVAQGFLHSSESSRIEVRLVRARGLVKDQIRMRGEVNPTAKKTVRRVLRKLMRHTRDLGALPMSALVKIAEPGRSFHVGGSFPMSCTPGPLESDTLGRVRGFRRIHAIDATVLPDIPATTITLSVMANAHRIASLAGKDDAS